MPSVALLLIGDEILTGEIVDQNGPFLIAHLRERGMRLARQLVVPDDAEVIERELRRLREVAEVVVVSGGIGPTHDDLTRQAVAKALGVPLVRDDEAAVRIQGFYGDATTDDELTMADLPEGSALTNGVKTGAFGFAVQGIYGFPGVPFIFRDLVRGMDHVFGSCVLHRVEIRSQHREGQIAGVLRSAQRDAAVISIGSYPVCENGAWHVRVVLRGEDPDRVESVASALRPQL